MSDGPHRSLPMRRHWKNLAERAAKAAYSMEEVREALPFALQKDLREAPLASIREVFSGNQGSLFIESEIARLEAIRQSSVHSAAGHIVIDCAVQAVAAGLTGETAYQAALENACDAQARSALRSVEEHYHREASARSAYYVRDRLDAARQQCDFKALAAGIAADAPSARGAAHLPRHTGLDEGPTL